ncbi:membrane protein [Virgisporangium aliadipatigenens]|uniref:Membrane protein n=1 Tax=Virgisporangium aliadipatigenens TaxID=741659 RepID=A0A8J3YJQ2_9ACTN|nr:hypothetical protein [Virgisporangium aliadipatigenens]GIJ45113.1 membrane protein [Virgisporangium aliadipatigenens]
MTHASDTLIARYVAGDDTIHADVLWGLEAHLSACAPCRARLAAVGDPAVTGVVDGVWESLAPRLAPVPRTRYSPRVVPAVAAWAISVVCLGLLAVLLHASSGGFPLLLPLSPVLPVLGVYASWARGADPAYEVVAATPRAGLELVLRRTLGVLAVLVPVLTAVGLLTGTSLGVALVPALAFTSATLALGSVVGVRRAAVALTGVWAAVCLAPPVLLDGSSYLSRPELVPLWGAAFVVGAVVTLLRRDAFGRLPFSVN